MASTNYQNDATLRPRWIPAFLVLVLLGFCATYFVGSVALPFGGALLLLIPLGLVVCALALGQVAKRLRRLAMSLSWWHGLWLLLFVSGLVFRVRGLDAMRETPVDSWAGLRVALVFTTALVLLVRLGLKKTDWLPSLFQGFVGVLTTYGLVCGLSTVWSVYPAWTFYKASEYLIDVALLAGILVAVRSLSEWKILYDWTWALLGGLSLTVWIGAAVWPTKAFVAGGDLLPARLSGVFPALDQNSVGETAAILAIIALARLLFRARQRRGLAFYLMLLAFALVTLVLSQTRTACVGFLLGTVLVFFSAKRRGMLTALVVSIAMILCFTIAGDLVGRYWQRNDRPEGLQSVSGRLPRWEAAWEMIKERPLTGYGAYAAGRFAVLTTSEDSEWSSVANTYVEVLVGTGIFGLIPLLVAQMGTWWMLILAVRRPFSDPLEHQLAIEGLGVLSILTIRSFTTSNFVWHPALEFLVVLGFAEFLRRSAFTSQNGQRA
jgi:O-Antigen ligase